MKREILRKIFRQSGAAALMAGAIFGTDAEASDVSLISRFHKTDFSDSAFLQYGDRWGRRPQGHMDYCARHPDDCKLEGFDSQAISLPMLDALKKTNAKINAMITPMEDLALYSKSDVWTIPPVMDDGRLAGDCEDYALIKRKLFHEDHGVPMNAMSIVIVVIPESVSLPPGTNRTHAILLVRAEDGDYIFDNFNNEALRPWETPYEYYGATAFDNFRVWKAVAQRHPQQLFPSYAEPVLLVYPPEDTLPAAGAVGEKDVPVPRIRPDFSPSDIITLTP